MPTYNTRVAHLQGISTLRFGQAPVRAEPAMTANGDMGGSPGDGFRAWSSVDPGQPGVSINQPCYSPAAIETRATEWNADYGDGRFTLLDLSQPKLWAGFTTDQDIRAPSLLPANGSNFLSWSGEQITQGAGAIQGAYLVQADPATGTEAGRWQIKLDSPALNTTFQRNGAGGSAYGTFGMRSAGNGLWACAFNASFVTPPSIIVLSADCTQYWLYVLVAVEPNALAALNWPSFGATNELGMEFLNTSFGPFSSGDFVMTGFGPSANLKAMYFQNDGRTVIFPPFPPVLTMPCVPCSPLSINGNTWAGRLA